MKRFTSGVLGIGIVAAMTLNWRGAGARPDGVRQGIQVRDGRERRVLRHVHGF
jgi:hypothetical protein